jgi:hypothetical protein
MNFNKLFIVPVFFLGFSYANALTGTALIQEKKSIEQFLKNLGYEDYSDMMANNLAARNFISPNDPEKGRTVLIEQIKTYKVFNDARSLATQLLSLLDDDRMDKDEAKKDLVDFTVQMLKLAPLMPVTEFPKEIDNEDKAWDFSWAEAERKVQAQTTEIAADLINVLFNRADEQKFARQPARPEYAGKLKEFTSARAKMTRLVKFMYTNSGMGHSAYLGKALAAGLLRQDFKNGNHVLKNVLSQKLQKQGLFLENFVGTNLKVTDHKSIVNDVEIKNGDFILERSYGLEAWQISFAARPFAKLFQPGNLLLANKYNLLGVLGGDQFHGDEDEESPLVTKLKKFTGKFSDKPTLAEYYKKIVLPTAEEKVKAATQGTVLNYGISHAGIAMVKTDTETGISMAWAVDVYPNAGLGGIRIMDILGQFARDGHYMRLGVSRHDPVKFYESVMKNQAYKKETNFHTGVQKPEDTVLWPTMATESDYNNLMATGDTDPQAWYAKVMRQSTDLIVSEYLGKGLGFSYGFKNEPGQAYCSQMVLLAGLQSSSVDFQSRPDVWDPAMLYMKKKGAKSTEGIDTDLRIVAPAGFMWQSDIVDRDSIKVISYKFLKNEFEMAQKMFMSSYKSVDATISNLIKKDSDFDAYVKHNFSSDDITGVAQDEMASYRALIELQKEKHDGEYSDNGRGFFGSTLNFVSSRRENSKQEETAP